MAKFGKKIKARKLRQKGKSIKEIAKILQVSKSSVSLWCRDIVLSDNQIKILQERMRKGSYLGCLKGALVQHQKRVLQISKLKIEGGNLINSLSAKDKMLIGIALYWGEGMKKEGTARIANSDDKIIKFMMKWFRDVWKITNDRFVLQILINKIHKNRVGIVEKYWSNLLKLPRNQFYKTTLIKTKNKKVYRNFSDHFGTVILSIRKGGDLRHKINGFIERLIKESQ